MSESRTKNFIYNSGVTALYQLVLIAANFITPHFLIHFYGSEANGLVSSITQFISYFSIVEAGLSGASVFALYSPLANKDYNKINSIVSATKIFYYKSGFVFAGLVTLLAVIYPFTVHVQSFSGITIAILVILLGAKGFMDFFSLAKYRALLTADQKTYVVSFASAVYIILNTIFIVVLSYLRVNILIVYAVAITSLIARTVILSVYCRIHYKYINYNSVPDNSSLDKRWDAMIWQVVQGLQTGAPTIIATFFASMIEVSIFSIYNMVIMGMSSILSIFRSGVMASFGELIAKKEYDTLRKSYNEFEYAYLQMIGILYSIAAVMLISFVRLYTVGNPEGIDYTSVSIMIFSSVNGVLYNMKTPATALISAAGHYRETRWRVAAQGIMLIGFSILFGIIAPPGWKIQGIILGSCISNLYRDIDMMIYGPRHVTFSSVLKPVKNYSLMFLTIALSVTAGFTIISHVNISSWLMWIAFAAIVTVISGVFALVISLLFSKNVLMSLFTRVKRMVIKR